MALLIAVLIILWAIGVFAVPSTGSKINILLIIAVLLGVFQVIKDRQK